MKHINNWSRKELLNLPVRAWNEESEYDSVLLLSTREKHDSGWAIMVIIGLRDFHPVEIACNHCDDIEWIIPTEGSTLRTDCTVKSGAMHVWSKGNKFIVGPGWSSVDIEVVRRIS